MSGADSFTATIRKDLFPYFTQNQKVAIAGLDLYGQDATKHHSVGDEEVWGTDTEDLAGEKQVFTVTIPRNGSVLTQALTHTAADAFLIVRYTLDKK